MAAEFQAGSREQAVVELVREHVTPLMRRLRGPIVDGLARRLIELEPPRPGYSEPQQLALYAVRMQHVARSQEEELGAVDRRFAAFSDRYFSRTGDRERRDLILDYLVETVPDTLARRADQRALDRFLDFDVLRERHLQRRHRLLVALEIAVTFIGRAGAASR